MAKQVSNADILSEVRAMNTRITTLESWRIAEDAAKKAVSDYRHNELQDQEQKNWLEITQKVGPFLVALTALAYALISSLKK